MTYLIVAIGLLILGNASVAMYSSVRIVEEGELRAVLVFGEMKGVLSPGLNIVPPFVSKTYPIDPRTMTIEKGDDRVAVPAGFEEEVRTAAEV